MDLNRRFTGSAIAKSQRVFKNPSQAFRGGPGLGAGWGVATFSPLLGNTKCVSWTPTVKCILK